MLLDHETDLFDHEENGDLLDCYWGNFGDFDDIEKLFRKNDSIFGRDGDGFVSASQDLINGTESIPMPDLLLFRDKTSNEDCTSFQLHDHDKRRRPSQKEKVDGQKMISSPLCKSEERRKSIISRNLKDNSNQRQRMESTDIHSSATTPLQTSNADSAIVHPGSSNQVTFTPHVHIDQSQDRPLCANYGVCNGDTKHQKTSNRLQDDKRETMTSQETAEKQRRLQKMQAKLAIEKQCLQYNHQNKQTLEKAQEKAIKKTKNLWIL
ncbi:uncharacterized protein A4U43_C05F740 [Asparagus officinalis]|uniref:Uncharacterized protein n=1 Tax=Asparagus officinalis TaxID=4686 RepID=A0A5P1ENC0_ASPOF|nr:uncharacterized protein LOC109839917 [Asparagus officinalis]XP_020263968.1 uncharacterized protein LOC109839917 [Asparagus officinalis]XP_020263969.1 uncharacterized protein LOC109839917 [Asparagus officinalis]XP_020263970.1 uncharacterized protein LOC109839917 [Asparagus officinalis]ONK67505.1 uncharacterized protein A4U43_C05F740 [Asparagus officinalis]